MSVSAFPLQWPSGRERTPAGRRRGAATRETARERGYTGDECQDCGSFAMVRNGTCLKCENCGATTGCS